jgi:hypothetical protein
VTCACVCVQLSLGQATLPRDGMRVAIVPPSSADEEYDDMDAEVEAEGAELRPLSYNQLLARVQTSLRKKSATAIYRVPNNTKKEKGGKGTSTARSAGSRSAA